MFHKEGFKLIIFSTILFVILNLAIWIVIPDLFWFKLVLSLILLFFWIIILQFFRNPKRHIPNADKNIVYAPADGKVVVIEEADEKEVLGEKYLQISIFMSPLNVHVNRHPVSGKITYFKYHPGTFLMAWNPKSSTDNERTTVVYELSEGVRVLVRQIAGFLARRIICYAKEGTQATQGEELGFIRFGSRVDVYLPKSAIIKVKIGDHVTGNKTVLATFK